MKYSDLSTYEGRQIFYQSKLWKETRNAKLTKNPFCEECIKNNMFIPATDVHHVIDIIKCPTIENATKLEGLQSLCKKCHSEITSRNQGFGKKFTPVHSKTNEYIFK